MLLMVSISIFVFFFYYRRFPSHHV